jgi:hypothetical protein
VKLLLALVIAVVVMVMVNRALASGRTQTGSALV